LISLLNRDYHPVVTDTVTAVLFFFVGIAKKQIIAFYLNFE